jgi:hypothetical protein
VATVPGTIISTVSDAAPAIALDAARRRSIDVGQVLQLQQQHEQHGSSERPSSPTPSIGSTIASISSVDLALGEMPLTLIDLLERCEVAEDQGEEPLAPTIRGLDLSGCANLTDVLVADVVCARFGGLRKLFLPQCIRLGDDAFLAVSASLPHLQEIDLSSCRLTDDALRSLSSGCTRLTTVTLRGCRRITDAGFTALASQGQLTSLDVSSCRELTDAGLGAVASGCPHLSVLSVALCPNLGREGCASWTHLCELTSLNLTATCSDDTTARLLAAAGARPDLISLNLSRTKITDAGMGALASVSPQLSTIYLAGCQDITDASLASLAAACSDLNELHVSGCGGVSDVGLIEIADGCAGLQVVSVDHCIATDASLLAFSQCPDLRQVSASGCSGVSDAGLVALAHGCACLERVDVRGCATITEIAIATVERHRGHACQLLVNSQLRSIW